jgi:hypothetical protein
MMKTIALIPNCFTLLRARAHLGLFLLLALLVPASLAWAAPYEQSSWKKNAKAGFELGFGTTYGSLLGDQITKHSDQKLDKIKVSPNWRIGVTGSYGFPVFGDALAIGPDIGLFLGTKRKFEAASKNVKEVFEERYLYIPCAFKLASFAKETGVQKRGLVLGYELNILLPSGVECSSSGIPNSGFDQLEGIAKSSKWGGSFFLGGRIDLIAGCYLTGQIKFPITDSLGAKAACQDGDSVKCGLYVVRALSTSFFELSLGFNIMKWL